MSDLQECRFCKNYSDGKCIRLSEDIEGFDVAVDVYYTEADMKLKLREALPSSGVPTSGVVDILNTCALIGRRKLAEIEKKIGELLSTYKEECIEKADELISDELFGLEYDSNFRPHIGVAVAPDFYCKYWE